VRGAAAGLAEAGMARAAIGGGMVEAGATRAAAGGFVAGAGETAATRVLLQRGLTSGSEGVLGGAMAEVSAGEATLLIDRAGVIRYAGGELGRLQGRGLVFRDQAIGSLERGYLYEAGGTAPIGRLRGVIPGPGVRVQLETGDSFVTLRPMLVDVMELSNGRYQVMMASGETAFVDTPLAALAVMSAAAVSDVCGDETGGGLLLRTSGEPVAFTDCADDSRVIVLQTDDGPVMIDRTEVQNVLRGEAAYELAGMDAGGAEAS